jgi:ubiquinone/menaquinone biosynthesis C-methylase UbiE
LLDVGTGPGLVVRLLAGHSRFIVGSDNSPGMLAHARSLLPAGAADGVTWVLSDAERLPFERMSFDAAVATNLLFLLSAPCTAVSELVRVVRPGGAVGWLNPSDRLSQESAADLADRRGLEGFARFSLINYGRIAEQHCRLRGQQWTQIAAQAGLRDIALEGRGDGLIMMLKGRKAGDG